ncbi:MAG: hypothetical protein AAGJ35_13490, partial [Myxococcota bacterium]
MSFLRPFLSLIAMTMCASFYLACGLVPTSTEPSQTTQESLKKQESSEEQHVDTQKPDAGTQNPPERISENASSSNDASSQETEESVPDKEHAYDASTPPTERDEDSSRTERDEPPDAISPTEQPPEQTTQPPPGFTLKTWCAQSSLVQGQWISQLSKGIDPKSDYMCKKSLRGGGGLQAFVLGLGYSFDEEKMLKRLALEGKSRGDHHLSLSELYEGAQNPFLAPKHKELMRKMWNFFRVPSAAQTKSPSKTALRAFEDTLAIQLEKQKRHAMGNTLKISDLPKDLGLLATQLQQQFNQDGKSATIQVNDIKKLFATASTGNDLT